MKRTVSMMMCEMCMGMMSMCMFRRGSNDHPLFYFAYVPPFRPGGGAEIKNCCKPK